MLFWSDSEKGQGGVLTPQEDPPPRTQHGQAVHNGSPLSLSTRGTSTRKYLSPSEYLENTYHQANTLANTLANTYSIT
jgi:hypothetical protein